VVTRDRLVIDLIVLYVALTRDLIATAVLNGADITMASKIANRLCRSERFSRHEFRSPGGRRWCYFQVAGAKPLGPDALARALAVANLCIYGGMSKLSDRAIREEYPFLPTKGSYYCLDKEIVCRVKVDLGGDADRIVRRLREFHLSLYHLDGYRHLVESGRFAFRVIVPSESRAEQVNRYLDMNPPPYPVITVVDDHLLELT
jgi:hypothetical protein